MKSFFFTILLFLVISCYCQDHQVSPSIIPQSPAAYSLGKYGDVPVSLYTGVPNIAIPVYTLTDHDLNVDVSLSYYGGGIKVDEVASFVGLGWSLNAGGVITRTIRGKAETLLSNGALFPERADIHFYNTDLSPSKSQYISDNKFEFIMAGSVDPEPDQFTFNFCGKSGKFVFDKNGVAVLQSQQALDIKWVYDNTYSNAQKFVVRDELGFVYEFHDYEFTDYTPPEGLKISTWYLSAITSPTGKIINFIYGGGADQAHAIRSYSTAFVSIIANNTVVTPPQYTVPFAGATYKELRLQQIVSQNGRIEFNYKNSNRLDLKQETSISLNRAALDNITIYHPNNLVLKKVKLITSYFEANNAHKYVPNDEFQCLNYRLRLDQVEEYSRNNSAIHPPYILTYVGDDNPSTDDKFTLPYRLSPEQDHLGFYNYSFNTHMIPGRTETSGITTSKWFTQLLPMGDPKTTFAPISGGANKASDADAMRAGLLKRITYPTGGYSEFTFEPNDYAGFYGGVRILKILNHPILGQSRELTYTYTATSYLPDPRKHYFEYYWVDFFQSQPVLPIEALAMFGIQDAPYPSGNSNNPVHLFKVTVEPSAILGAGSAYGYSVVTVAEAGNGSTTSTFASSTYFRDYESHEVFQESTPAETSMIEGDLFLSQAIDDSDYPNPEGNVETKTEMTPKDWPYPETYDNSWKRGVLTNRITRSENNIVLKEENFSYKRQLLSLVPGFKVRQDRYHEFFYSKYYRANGWIAQSSAETKSYDKNGQNPITQVVSTFYDNISHLQPTRVETTRSDGKKEVTILNYPGDYSSGTTFIDDMKTNHLISYPIEQVKYLENGGQQTIIGGNIITYKSGGKALKDQQLNLETWNPVPLSSFKFSNHSLGVLPHIAGVSSSTSYLKDSHFSPRLQFDFNLSTTNLVRITEIPKISISGLIKSYLWGYNDQYPISEINNASENEVYYNNFESGATIGAAHMGIGYHNGALTVNWTAPNNRAYVISYWYLNSGVWKYSGELPYSGNSHSLANGSAYDDVTIYPKSAQVTTFAYDPMVGMTANTDAKGMTTYFEYDEYQRLTTVRDVNRNITKKICYNYAGQSTNCSVAYSNTAQILSFRKSNCTVGIGLVTYYTVPPGAYTSTSVEAANALAISESQVVGQQFANQTGNCTELYAGIFLENEWPDLSGTHGDLYVRLYTDANKTSPVSNPNLPSPVTIYYQKHDSGVSPYDFYYNLGATGEVYIDNVNTSYYDSNNIWQSVGFSLVSSPNYSIVY